MYDPPLGKLQTTPEFEVAFPVNVISPVALVLTAIIGELLP
jgi:hypothetical protein